MSKRRGAIIIIALSTTALIHMKCEQAQQSKNANRQESPAVTCAKPFGPEASTLGKEDQADKVEEAMFGAGCFWGVEATFRRVEGVLATAVGYAGGTTENPTYREVCSDRTGHAEVVHVKFDPTVVSYDELLETFWSCHDPTTRNRQGPDIGSQYRSVIFTYSPQQKAAAEKSLNAMDESGRFPRRIVTEIKDAPTFYRAEDYHQQYLEKKSGAHYSGGI